MSNTNTKWSAEEKQIRSTFQPKILQLIPLSIIFMATFPYLVLTNHIDLAPNVQPTELVDFSAKLQFALRYQIVGVMWMIFCMWSVIAKRFPSPAVNPMSGYEHLTEIPKNIMTNSLEQLMMSVLTQFSLLTYLDGDETKKIIPMLTIMFIVGRITFWAGYPTYRSFGFWVTMWPTQIAMWICFAKFINFAIGWNSYLAYWGAPMLFYAGFYMKLRYHRHNKF